VAATRLVTIPERTIDAWLSIYLSQRFPLLGLWAPTRTWDFALDPGLPRGKIALLECKTTRLSPAGETARIRWDQLRRYLHHTTASPMTYYVFPDTGTHIRGRVAGSTPVIPPEATGLWTCSQWLWVISAWRLANHLVTTGARLNSGEFRVPVSEVMRIDGARPLLLWAQELENCQLGYRIEPEPGVGIRDPGVGPGPEDAEYVASADILEWEPEELEEHVELPPARPSPVGLFVNAAGLGGF
jgi:hypothetical protein